MKKTAVRKSTRMICLTLQQRTYCPRRLSLDRARRVELSGVTWWWECIHYETASAFRKEHGDGTYSLTRGIKSHRFL
jgi:hypothetical protein